ncbi:MAG: NAD(P)H-hydrate dehydratase [Hespellia sp.]|nr:NAD(P)H-hydrate dehydratase [Hespellia sp.]
MRYLPDRTLMQKADERTIQDIGIPAIVLMERAALGCVAVMEDQNVDFSNTLIVCGSGNNGGDGFAIARLLAMKQIHPIIAFAGHLSSLSVESRQQIYILQKLGIPIESEIPDDDYTCVIDALFGVGLNRPIKGAYREHIQKMNQMPGEKVAVDIPSGIDASTGQVLGCAFRAELTISMAFEKLGTVLDPGREYAGIVVPVEIGIPSQIFAGNEKICVAYEKEDLSSLLPARAAASHKGTYGKVLMIVGSAGMCGAAYLSAKAAYAVGAGIIRIYTHEENRIVLQELLPEAIVSTYREYDEKQLKMLLDWSDTAAIGCGLGKSKCAEQMLGYLLKNYDKTCVIDADGINLLSEHMTWLKEANAGIILTPHLKEMSRMTGQSVDAIAARRFEVLEQFVLDYPAVCVLKDARTLVAKKKSRVYVNLSGCAAMAKAGSGDVLAGIITGLTAQKKDRLECACLGTFLHGLAGEMAAKELGMYSVLASDQIDYLSRVLR